MICEQCCHKHNAIIECNSILYMHRYLLHTHCVIARLTALRVQHLHFGRSRSSSTGAFHERSGFVGAPCWSTSLSARWIRLTSRSVTLSRFSKRTIVARRTICSRSKRTTTPRHLDRRIRSLQLLLLPPQNVPARVTMLDKCLGALSCLMIPG